MSNLGYSMRKLSDASYVISELSKVRVKLCYVSVILFNLAMLELSPAILF